MTFWSGREAENPIDDDDLWTVELWETYVRAVHDETYSSNVCGNDQWMDNHYSWDPSIWDSDIQIFADQAEKLGLKYHWWAINVE